MSKYELAEASQLSKPSVHRLAESVAKQVGWQPTGDIKKLMKKLGGRVDVEDTLLLDSEQTGSLFVDGPSSFRIIVPSHTSPERDRFTVAHEFGHFVLHYLWQRQKNPDYPEKVIAYRRGSERIEWEANWFAAAFLMPSKSFRETFSEFEGDIWSVAEVFQVSTKAAEIRAKDLGLAA